MTTDHPIEIEKRAIYLSNVTLERDAIRERLQIVEDRITYDVLTERDGNGKPLHSNDALRGIAVRERLLASTEWLKLKADVEAVEVLRVEATARLERSRNEFSKWKIEERARIAEMEVGA